MANPAELTAQELIDRYSIRHKLVYCPTKGLVKLDEIVVAKTELAMAEQAYNPIAAKTEEITALLKAADEAAAAAEAAKAAYVAAIEGMAELKAEKEGGAYYKLLRKYPKAAAYIEAENWANSSIAAKVAAGRVAVDAIANGEDPDIVIDEMNHKFRAYVSQLSI